MSLPIESREGGGPGLLWLIDYGESDASISCLLEYSFGGRTITIAPSSGKLEEL